MRQSKLLSLIIILAIGILSCSEDNESETTLETSNSLVLTKPKVLISLDDALAKTNALYLNLDAKNSKDTQQFFDVNIEDLKQYLNYIEQESNKADVDIKGLRFYFGRDPNASITEINKKTIFYNPVTSFPGIEGNISYVIKTDENGDSEAVTIGSVIDEKRSRTTDSTIKSESNITTLIGNDVIWPPPPIQKDPNDFH